MAVNSLCWEEKSTNCFHRIIVVVSAICAGFLNWGILQSFSTFLPSIIDTFAISRSKASVIHSVMIAVACVNGVASGSIIKKWGTDKLVFVGSTLVSLGFIISYFAKSLVMLYIFIGLIAGLGISFTYTCAVVVLGKMFTNKGQTALLSIQNVATGIAGIVLPYFISWCLELYALSGSFLLFGGLLLNNFACAMIIRSTGKNQDVIKEKKTTYLDQKVSTRGIVFCLFLVSVTVCLGNMIGIFVMILDILKYKGLSNSQGLNCLIVVNLAGTCARFLPWGMKVLLKQSMITVILSSLSGLVGALTFMFGTSYVSMLIGSIFIGICDGATASSIAPVVFMIVKPDGQEVGYGIILTAIGFMAAGTPPLYGAIFDITESYILVLLISAIAFGVSCVTVILCNILYYRQISGIQNTKL